MRYQSILFLTVLCALFWSCKDRKMPTPNTPEVRFEGAIYIGCDIGPYGLNMDSLIAYCTSIVDLTYPVDSIDAPCVYDEIGPLLSSEFHVQLKRGDVLNVIELASVSGDPQITEIQITIAGEEYAWGEYPYYSGYELKWDMRTLRIHAINKWVGGCFHDLLLWEVIVN